MEAELLSRMSDTTRVVPSASADPVAAMTRAERQARMRPRAEPHARHDPVLSGKPGCDSGASFLLVDGRARWGRISAWRSGDEDARRMRGASVATSSLEGRG
mgnify:CR=1 FL=1